MSSKSVKKPKTQVKEAEGVSNEAKKYEELKAQLSSVLLSKKQMIKGSPSARQRNARESQYQPLLDELNEIGLKIGVSKVGFGDLRRD